MGHGEAKAPPRVPRVADGCRFIVGGGGPGDGGVRGSHPVPLAVDFECA